MHRKRRVLLLLPAYDPLTHQASVQMARELDWHLDTNLLTPQKMINHWSGDGIMCSLTDDESRVAFCYIKESNLPAVDLSTWRTDFDIPRVSTNNEKLGELAGEHFVKNGHYNFAWYSSSPTPFGERRLEAFTKTVSHAKHSVIRLDAKGCQNHSVMLRRIRNLPRPCAILCMNDADASWLASLCQQEGYHIPMDFSILGIDDNPLICEVQDIGLSSIDKNTTAITRAAALTLQQLMDGEPVIERIKYIEPRGIVTRESSNTLSTETRTSAKRCNS